MNVSRTAALFAFFTTSVAAVVACGDDSSGSDDNDGIGANGTGNSGSGADGTGGLILIGGSGADSGTGNNGSGGGPCGSELTGVIRDFRASHPDFENVIAVDSGIVEDTLGMDMKPVYAGNPTTPTTNGQMAFDQWYRDTADVNMPIPYTIQLTDVGNGLFRFDDPDFFPIDDQGFGNEGNAHNYHFTFELHTEFEYKGGEVFTFTGDDDLWTFINGRLAIDLGGVHGPLSDTIDLDAQANALGIEVGETYNLDFFFAERHTSESNFRIDTSITCFTSLPVPN